MADAMHARFGSSGVLGTRSRSLVLAAVLGAVSGLPACDGSLETSPDVLESSAAVAVAPAARQLDGAVALSQPDAVRPPDSSYTLFESGPVRPLALSPSGKTLFVCNIPDGRLEVFRVGDGTLVHRGSIPVGLEPVAVAALDDRVAWVVNHLSDSVSIVELNDDDGGAYDDAADFGGSRSHRGRSAIGEVVQTLLVGDEPRDIVFGGRHRDRAFITTAHRGQNVPYDPKLTTPGQDRADVWVFDTNATGRRKLGGSPLTIVTLFTDTPRALAVTPDGGKVYAAGFQTGNRTTTISGLLVPDQAEAPDNLTLPAPRINHAGVAQPLTGLIVKFNGKHWVDEDGKIWDSRVRFNLPDKDVFVIDANAEVPALVGGPEGAFSGVGTVLFNMIVNPRNGRVYVSNTEAFNEHRFEGHGEFLKTLGKTSVRGHLTESRITVLGGNPRVNAVHLNKHINYSDCCAAIPNAENARSVSTPLDMAITNNGRTLYVASFGTSEVEILDTAALEANTFTPDAANQIKVSGGGPGGLALDERHDRLYVFTRFDDAVSVIDTRSKREIAHIGMFNPEPRSVVKGRRFLYDASHASSHGDSSCGSCHIFGDFDSLAWDLGDPDGDEFGNAFDATDATNPAGSKHFHSVAESLGFPPLNHNFRPMKGPMTTQSLRGMANHGPMHWRGDRVNNTEKSEQPNRGIFDEEEAFRRFNPAFEGLLGRNEPIPATEMQAFSDFALQLTYPPNPNRNLDDSLTPEQQAGHDFFFSDTPSDNLFSCHDCHVTDRNANAQFGVAKPGFFGTDGRYAFDFLPQYFKVPHLRNLYQKVGMFGQPETAFLVPGTCAAPCVGTGESNGFMGDQVRGFGFLHDGSADSVNRFLSAVAFSRNVPGIPLPNPGGFEASEVGNKIRRQVEQYLLAFETNLKPVVGQQVTVTADNQAVAAARVALLIARAEAGDCELIAKRGGQGYLYAGRGNFRQDRRAAPVVSRAALLSAPGEVTFTAVPLGSGVRLGIDRDQDGVLDGDE
jgi:DNA-binding beta-propeller fold protein YncE